MKKLFLFLSTNLIALGLSAQSLYFPPNTGNTWDTLSPQTLGYCQTKIDSLYAFLEQNNTRAFILLQDGKIVLEKYFGSHTPTTPWQWASAGKTITSFMVGMAEQEGYLSIQEPTSTYLGQGWTSCTPAQEDKITIENQLSMTTGLDDKVPDPTCTQDTCLIFKAEAGTRWAYHNAPYTILDQVIEDATGQTLNRYTTQKLKNPTGMTGAFLPVGSNNVYFSNARSMARFGLLILNKGNWNGSPIMTDSTYFNQMVNTSQSINASYGYLWWLNGKESYRVPGLQTEFAGFLNPNAPADMIVAAGKDGQFLNVIPSQNRVWIRMGEAPDNLPVPFLLNDNIWQYVNELPCTTTSVDHSLPPKDIVQIQVFPNPSDEVITLTSDKTIKKVEIYNGQGQSIIRQNTSSKETIISLRGIQSGLIFLRVELTNGSIWTGKVIKQ
jgi:CubicO group peptidase (beta-lactamase class C family)